MGVGNEPWGEGKRWGSSLLRALAIRASDTSAHAARQQVSVAGALRGDSSSPAWRERLKIERPAGQGKAANPAALHSYTGHDQTANLTLTATYGSQAANRYELPIHALRSAYSHSACLR